MMNMLIRRLTALALSLTIALCLIIPAAAAETYPVETLKNVGYMGIYGDCEMPAAMADAYIRVLNTLPDNGKAYLVDPNNDGMPLLVTTSADGWEGTTVWSWNGSTAQAVPFEMDSETGEVGSATFGHYNGLGAIHIRDGYAQDFGFPVGDLIYTVQNGKVTMAHRHMLYSAVQQQATDARAVGSFVPTVATTSSDIGQSAAISDLLSAGYVKDPERPVYYLQKVDSKFYPFTSYANMDRWVNAHEIDCFQEYENQIYSDYDYNSPLLGKWVTISAMRNAITNYVDKISSGKSFAITVSPTANGTLTANKATATSGTTVLLEATASRNYRVQSITVTDGTGKNVPVTQSGYGITFVMPASPVTVRGFFTVSDNPFNDVKESDYFCTPVLWAVGKGITNGTSATTFSPNRTCTVAHILTFLWRAQGQPQSTITNPFGDVSTDAYYYKAALWAYEKGLVSGKWFRGNDPCTRFMAVTYFWKLNGSPVVGTGSSFSDVSVSDPYATAVRWAVQKNITNGTSATTFSPDKTCTRAQIVTFLWRMKG